MSRQVIVRRGTYQDSARLMRIARELGSLPGVVSADVMMATPANVQMLADAGFSPSEFQSATPMDMVVALAVHSLDVVADAEARLATLLAGTAPGSSRRDGGQQSRPGSVAEAVRAEPETNLVSIAVPGPYAAFVANRALDAGRHVFLFSDNVPLEEEVALKRRACASGLLLMGPDCGTAIIAGTGLGFANRVPRGHVGIVGASGTGIQEVSCLLARLGAGVSHAIGTGSRDLSAAVDGMMSEFALRLLAEDADTRVVVLVAKHPAPSVADRLHAIVAALGKPAVVRYLGDPARPACDGVVYADTLDEAAEIAASGGLQKLKRVPASFPKRVPASISGRLVGLFGGGSLAAEAQHVLASCGIATTTPGRALVPGQPIGGTGNLIVDTGDDAYTVGRPHPMVDQTVRCALIRSAAADRAVSVVLLDLVLGDGAHPDPAPEIAAAVAEARAARGDAPLAVVCSVCGTAADPQGFDRQVAALEAAGIHTEPTAARAAYAAAAMQGGDANGVVR